jgi:hypothetical protein
MEKLEAEEEERKKRLEKKKQQLLEKNGAKAKLKEKSRRS